MFDRKIKARLAASEAEVKRLRALLAPMDRGNLALRLDAAIRRLAARPEPLLALYPRWLPEETYRAYALELAQAYRARSHQPLRLH